MGARETALCALIACRVEGAWSNGILKQYVSRDRLDRREAALAFRLCCGVIQNRMKLDFYLKQLLTGKLRDLHPAVRDILHLGLYQLKEMDRIPDSAAVNESVELAKKYCKKQKNAPGLVNAVLRNAVRQADSLKEPTSYEELYSHPEALLKLFKAYVGKGKLEPMLQENNRVAPTVAQVNTLRVTAEELVARLENEGVSTTPHRWMENALVLDSMGDLEALKAFREGLFYVQDPAARLAVDCLQLPKREIRVLDCCAAPGGKSFAAAIATGGLAQITSCDIHAHKVSLMEKGAARLGLGGISPRLQDGAEFVPQWEAQMDAVICDVPCSGYGIIRKKPDIRYKDPATMADLPELQLEILTNASRYVKPGGVLLYSTCTLVRTENEGVVEAFLENHPEFSLEELPLPAEFEENKTGMLALIPGQHDTDGFFIAKLRKSLP